MVSVSYQSALTAFLLNFGSIAVQFSCVESSYKGNLFDFKINLVNSWKSPVVCMCEREGHVCVPCLVSLCPYLSLPTSRVASHCGPLIRVGGCVWLAGCIRRPTSILSTHLAGFVLHVKISAQDGDCLRWGVIVQLSYGVVCPDWDGFLKWVSTRLWHLHSLGRPLRWGWSGSVANVMFTC